jgi:nucleotide-binding universal stress UspA family protein/hemerythrin-like domain-containing protein
MYKHLLVPVDETTASSANVDAALSLARCLQARVTFFHATNDWGATADGELTRVLSPTNYRDMSIGNTHALLAKAAASAKVVGVACEVTSRTSDRPADAIIETAQAQGCDLIVMGSRGDPSGLSGWLHGSQTKRILSHTPIALLVTRVETGQPLRPEETALGIIRDEHRSIAVVVQGMQDITREAATRELAPDVASLERMVAYLHDFPESVHHPKEEAYLHRCLRERHPESGVVLAKIEEQHAKEGALLQRVGACIAQLKVGTSANARELADAVDDMGIFMLKHIGHEERVLLPLARQYLQEQDWVEIADAFAKNNDPRFGDLPDDTFRRHFTQIANSLATSPPRQI